MHYKELEVWKEAMNLVEYVYKLTNYFPKDEKFGITSQIRRSAISIPSNIAEGVVKHSDKETLRFLDIALGSLAELDTQMEISTKIGYIDSKSEFFDWKYFQKINEQIPKVNALLQGFIKYYNNQLKDDNALVP